MFLLGHPVVCAKVTVNTLATSAMSRNKKLKKLRMADYRVQFTLNVFLMYLALEEIYYHSIDDQVT
jgi:hypothetical protein